VKASAADGSLSKPAWPWRLALVTVVRGVHRPAEARLIPQQPPKAQDQAATADQRLIHVLRPSNWTVRTLLASPDSFLNFGHIAPTMRKLAVA
jgi:hypothetical protein